MAEWKVTLHGGDLPDFTRTVRARNRRAAIRKVREEHFQLYPEEDPRLRASAEKTGKDEMTKQDWRDLRRGVASGDVPNPLGGQ